VSAGRLVLNGGLDTAGGGITIASGATLQARSFVNRAVAGGGTIIAGGSLVIGNNVTPTGFAFNGTLNVGTHQVVLDDADAAQLGTSTTLDAGGRLISFNGITLANGRTLTVNAGASASISGNFINNGTATGPTLAGQLLTFSNNVSGTGSIGGQVRFSGGLSPGNNGPAAITLNSFTFAETTTLSLEIGGLAAGTQYDRLNFPGTGVLDGVLSVTLTGGFQPVQGNTFTLLDGGTLSGAFDTINLPGLSPGLAWDYVQTASDATLIVIPEPSAALLLVGGAMVFGARRKRR
jgi:hypothetical protein